MDYYISLLDQYGPVHDDEGTNKEEESVEDFYQRDFAVAELISEVEVEFPRNGGRIEAVEGHQNRFRVVGKNGEFKRELFMNKKGKVFEEVITPALLLTTHESHTQTFGYCNSHSRRFTT